MIWPTFAGTEAEYHARLERVGIMAESGVPETDAHMYCNMVRGYGCVPVDESQETLF